MDFRSETPVGARESQVLGPCYATAHQSSQDVSCAEQPSKDTVRVKAMEISERDIASSERRFAVVPTRRARHVISRAVCQWRVEFLDLSSVECIPF